METGPEGSQRPCPLPDRRVESRLYFFASVVVYVLRVGGDVETGFHYIV